MRAAAEPPEAHPSLPFAPLPLTPRQQDCKAVIEKKLKVDMSPLLHIRPYMLDSYGHVISDKSATNRIFATNDAFRGLKAPTTQLPDGTYVANYNMRYFTEDLPHGLAVLRNIGELCGVKTPMMDTVLEWAQAKVGHEYLVNGKIQGKDVAHSGCPAVWPASRCGASPPCAPRRPQEPSSLAPHAAICPTALRHHHARRPEVDGRGPFPCPYPGALSPPCGCRPIRSIPLGDASMFRTTPAHRRACWGHPGGGSWSNTHAFGFPG
jgi:hypothetical protein